MAVTSGEMFHNLDTCNKYLDACLRMLLKGIVQTIAQLLYTVLTSNSANFRMRSSLSTKMSLVSQGPSDKLLTNIKICRKKFKKN